MSILVQPDLHDTHFHGLLDHFEPFFAEITIFDHFYGIHGRDPNFMTFANPEF